MGWGFDFAGIVTNFRQIVLKTPRHAVNTARISKMECRRNWEVANEEMSTSEKKTN